MPTLDDGEEDWNHYNRALEIASRRLWGCLSDNRQESLNMGWQVHRLAMNVMETEVWKRYPAMRKIVWSNLRSTAGFMDTLMNYDDISRADRAKWRPQYLSYIDARNKAEGRRYYAYRCRTKAEENAGDPKRKWETTITTEIVVKRQRAEDSEDKDTNVEDSVAMEDIETKETVHEAKEKEETATEGRGIRGIFADDSDKEEEAEGSAGDPWREEAEGWGDCVSGKERVGGTRETAEEATEDQPRVRPEGVRWGGEEEGNVDEDNDTVHQIKRPGVEDDKQKGVVIFHGQESVEELEGRRGVDKRGRTFIIKHGFRSEETLYNYLIQFGRVLDIVKEDGSEIQQPENLPQILLVKFEKVESDSVWSDQNQDQQKWKMGVRHFENITLKQGGGMDRWDICCDEDVLELIGNYTQIRIHMKCWVQKNEFYSIMTNVLYDGQKVETCEKGKICIALVTEDKEIRMPGRFERKKSHHIQKTIDMKDIKLIETK